MKTKYLKIKAGKKAYKLLQKEGLHSEMVSVMSSAAGGPKWIILYAMDKYLMQNFFSSPSQKLDFIGGSIGAWRSSCYLLPDGPEAINRLKENYLNQRYSAPFSKQIVSDTCKDIILNTLGEGGKEDILKSKNRTLHIMTTGAYFNTNERSDNYAKMKFASIAVKNFFYRTSMNKQLFRSVYSSQDHTLLLPDGITTETNLLTNENLIPAMRASGAIPLSIHPIEINGKEHWDGGLMDYHLDLKYNVHDKIVLYPHFLPFIKPGWFDKYHNFRFSKHHENTLLLYPSEEFVSLLPDQKLTDLKDFYTYADQPDLRIKKWYEAAALGRLLVDDFKKLQDPQTLQDNLELF